MYIEIRNGEIYDSLEIFKISVFDGKIMGETINGTPMFFTDLVEFLYRYSGGYILAIRRDDKSMRQINIESIAGILLRDEKLVVDMQDEEFVCDIVKIFTEESEECREELLIKIDKVKDSLMELRDLLVRACPDKLMK